MNGHRLALRLLYAGLLLGLLFPGIVRAHGGGTPRLTAKPAGPYSVYAWSEPEPWRVGEAHLSIAVTQPNPDGSSTQVELPVTDAAVQVSFIPISDPAAAIVVEGTLQNQLDNIYYEADTILPSAGDWRVEIAVQGAEGRGTVDFTLEALPPRTVNWTLVGAAGGVLLLMLIIMGIWSRAQPPAAQAGPRARRLQRG
jgi:hypothetical protein